MVGVAEKTFSEVDLVLWLVEATTFIGRGERYIAEELKQSKAPVILVMNKIDTIKKDELLECIAAYKDMMEFAVKLNKPVVIRYPRGGQDENVKFEEHQEIELGKSEILKEGKGISIIAIGKRVADAMKMAEIYKKEDGIEAEVINARFLKPLDVETIKKSIEKTKNVITIEDGTKINGLGTAIEELIVENNLQNIKFEKQAWPDEFLKQGTSWDDFDHLGRF